MGSFGNFMFGILSTGCTLSPFFATFEARGRSKGHVPKTVSAGWKSVSYTHLDVYKRQVEVSPRSI